MTKKSIIALVSTTVLLTQGAVAFADEAVPIDPTAPSTGVLVPDTSQSQDTDTSETSPVDPTVPSTLPSTDESTSPSETLPDTGSQTETTTPETPVEPEPETPTDTGEVDVPTTDGGTTTITPGTDTPTNNPNVSADTAQQAGASQVGTTSTVTGQIVRDVTTANSVTLSNGATITDIRDGLVTLSTGEKVTPESVNLTSNADGTYTAKTIQGDMVTLPHTGDTVNPLRSILGTVLLALVGLLITPWKKVKHLAPVFSSR